MNVFQAAKGAGMIAVAEWLGFQVKRGGAGRGMICCPFHQERTPSMALYEEPGNNHYYCFGCHAHGDTTNLYVQARGGRPVDAAKEICRAFGIGYDTGYAPQRDEPARQHAPDERQLDRQVLAAAVEEMRRARVTAMREFQLRCHEQLISMIQMDQEDSAEYARTLFTGARALEEAERWDAMDTEGLIEEIREVVEETNGKGAGR